jgi:hypothetical protein
MDTPIAAEESLSGVLGARARRTPADRLAIDVVGGALIGAAAIWARPTAWLALFAAATCFFAYGCWAVTERRMHADPSSPAPSAGAAWRYGRHASATLGLAAFITLLFALLGLALGPIKS